MQIGVALGVDDVLRGGEAHLLQRVAGGFEGVDLGGGELVGDGLVPVGSSVLQSVEGEAGGFDALLPVRAGRERKTLHALPKLFAGTAAVASPSPSPPAKEEPKPPRGGGVGGARDGREAAAGGDCSRIVAAVPP